MIITIIIFMVIAYCIVRGGTYQELPEIKEKMERKTRVEYEPEKKKIEPEV